jgi:hypothetical protein
MESANNRAGIDVEPVPVQADAGTKGNKMVILCERHSDDAAKDRNTLVHFVKCHVPSSGCFNSLGATPLARQVRQDIVAACQNFLDGMRRRFR